MKLLKLKIRELLDRRQDVLWKEREREYLAQKIFEMLDRELEMFYRELQRQKPKKTTLQKINQYKAVLKLAGVPKFLIENPQFIKGMPPTKEDIEWAKNNIQKFKNNH